VILGATDFFLGFRHFVVLSGPGDKNDPFSRGQAVALQDVDTDLDCLDITYGKPSPGGRASAGRKPLTRRLLGFRDSTPA
jgi:hypothetical protein